MNELYFLVHSFTVSSAALIALRLGKEALVGFISICCILANLFVLKQTTLFGLDATCSDAFAIGAVFGLNLLQEYFGKSIARSAIWISFFLLFFYTIVSSIHLLYEPSAHDTMQQHYAPILQFMPRIAIASLAVYIIVQQLDTFLYGILKYRFQGRYLTVRNYISISLCQLIDTILFSFLGLYGIVENVWHIIAISYSIKLLLIFTATPFIMLSKKVRPVF